MPSFQDLADRLETTREKIENLYLTFNNSDTQSLNAPVNNDGEDNEFGMFVPSAEDLEDNVVNDANKKEVIDLIKIHLNQGVHKNGKPFIIAPKEGHYSINFLLFLI